MFTESLCDASLAHSSHCGWTTLASFGLQALAIAILMTIPLLFTQGLPALKTAQIVFMPDTPTVTVPLVVQHSASSIAYGNSSPQNVRPISQVPTGTSRISEVAAPEMPPSMPWETTSSDGNPISQLIEHNFVRPAGPPTVARLQRVSNGVMEGTLLERIQPIYPKIAISTHIQGEVVLQALISRTGTIENLQVVSGHPMLIASAIDAVRQWRYRPYRLNGEPVEVETQITVKFSLSGD